MLHQLPPDLVKIDADSRERWSVAAAILLMQQLSLRGLQQLLAAGKQKFFRDARLAYERQDFRDDDYERMWRMLNAEFKKASAPQSPLIHG